MMNKHEMPRPDELYGKDTTAVKCGGGYRIIRKPIRG